MPVPVNLPGPSRHRGIRQVVMLLSYRDPERFWRNCLSNMAKTTLRVGGMTCQHCVRAVTQALEAQEGVTRADVDLKAGRAVIEYDAALVTPGVLEGAVMDEGY